MRVELRPDEITICQIIGRLRTHTARSAGVRDAKIGKQDGADADVIGFTAEYAFAKHFNIFPDIGLVPRSGSPDGIFQGKTYDVKATVLSEGRLLCTLKENNEIDLYILAIVNLPHVDFVGYATSGQLRSKANITDLGHGDGYALKQAQLRTFKCDEQHIK